MDFVKIDYTAAVKDGGVFDTTDSEIAKKENIFDSKRVYGPLPVIVGEGQVVKGLDEILAGLNASDEREVEIPPEKAFGVRDASLIRLVPMKVFKQQGINPIPGMPVELDGRHARVQTVAGGRVRVDFNHELAGRTLKYKVKVVSKAVSDDEKARLLVERSFNESEGFAINLSGRKATIELPEKAFRDRNILFRKASLSAELFKYLSMEEVDYSERWVNPKSSAVGDKEVK